MAYTPKNKKVLRQLYMQNAEAKAFLEAHPEFDDRFLEQSEINNPGFDTAKGRYTLNEVPTDQTAHAETMLEAVKQMRSSPSKTLLELYYDGKSVGDLMLLYGIPDRGILDSRLKRAKKQALRQLKQHPPSRLFDQVPHATKVFTRGDIVKFIYLIWDEAISEHVWVDEAGIAFPESIQEVLNDSEEFKEWDEIFL